MSNIKILISCLIAILILSTPLATYSIQTNEYRPDMSLDVWGPEPSSYSYFTHLKIEVQVNGEWFTIYDKDSPKHIRAEIHLKTSFSTQKIRVTVNGKFYRSVFYPKKEWSVSSTYNDVQDDNLKLYPDFKGYYIFVSDRYDFKVVICDHQCNIYFQQYKSD